MATFPVKGKPDVSVLTEFFEPTDPVQVEKRAARLAASTKARGKRRAVKELKNQRAVKDKP